LLAIAEQLQRFGEVKLNPYVLRVTLHGEQNEDGEAFGLTLFVDGRAMIHGTKKPAEAKSLYARLVGG